MATEILQGQVRIDTTQANQSLGQLGQTAQQTGAQINTSMGNASQGVGRFGSSAAGTVSSLRSFTQQTNQIREGMNGVIGTAGNIVSAMGQIASAMQNPAQNAQELTSQMVGLAGTGTAIGAAFGPGGALVGAIAGAAVPALISLWDSLVPVVPALEEVAEQADDTATSIDSLATSFTGASDRMRTFLQGISSSAQTQRLAETNAQITEMSDRIQQLRAGQGTAFERTELPALQERLLQTIALSNELTAAMETSGGGRTSRRGGGGGGGASAGDSLMAEIQAEMEMNAMLREEELRRAQEQIDLEKATAEQSIEIATERQQALWRLQEQDKARLEQAAQQQQATAAGLAADADAAEEAFNNLVTSNVETILQSYDAMNRANGLAGRSMAGFGKIVERTLIGISYDIVDVLVKNVTSGFQAMVTGAMTADEAFAQMAKGILQSITELAVGEAVKNFAYALANLAEGIATQNPSKIAAAAAFASAGAMWTVVGGVAGGAMAATSGGGGGGNVLAGADTSGAAGTAGAGSAQNNQMDAPASDTGPKTVVVNYSGTVFATKDEMKRELKRIANS